MARAPRAHAYDARNDAARAEPRLEGPVPHCWFCGCVIDTARETILRPDQRKGWDAPRRSCALCADRALDKKLGGTA